jgi:hypothetical protein
VEGREASDLRAEIEDLKLKIDRLTAITTERAESASNPTSIGAEKMAP